MAKISLISSSLPFLAYLLIRISKSPDLGIIFETHVMIVKMTPKLSDLLISIKSYDKNNLEITF